VVQDYLLNRRAELEAAKRITSKEGDFLVRVASFASPLKTRGLRATEPLNPLVLKGD
jgi:hypothetical protein